MDNFDIASEVSWENMLQAVTQVETHAMNLVDIQH